MAEPAGLAESESELGDSDSVYSNWLPISPPESEPESETLAMHTADWVEWPQHYTKILNFNADEFLPAGADGAQVHEPLRWHGQRHTRP